MMQHDYAVKLYLDEDGKKNETEVDWPVLVCVLGGFRLIQAGRTVLVPNGGKTELLLSLLALHAGRGVSRENLLGLLWPNHEPALAGQSLNSLVYSLRKQFAPTLEGSGLVQHLDGCYRLNREAGVNTDLACFEDLVRQGHQQSRQGCCEAAMTVYSQAVDIYQGDLWLSLDTYALTERERLRAIYLTLLARLADHCYSQDAYAPCLDYARRLLSSDPCREDAHRLLMRCYVRQGERAQALRQYQLCTEILRAEFSTTPEPATTALFEHIRLDPDAV